MKAAIYKIKIAGFLDERIIDLTTALAENRERESEYLRRLLKDTTDTQRRRDALSELDGLNRGSTWINARLTEITSVKKYIVEEIFNNELHS